MDRILSHVRARQNEIIALIEEFVKCESPSDDAAAVSRFCDLFTSKVSGIARVKRIPGGVYGPHLQCEFQLPGTRKSGQILALGHSDTVYAMGTLAAMPYRRSKGRLWGPGVFDMKSGIAFFVFAMRALRDWKSR
jgi:Acetylornithine deacetylase/Succinyl-diaminopimelate desuccinylase and related deacylases